MTWINPLDRLPQIPQDYANHMLWAAFGWLGIVFAWPHPHVALAIMSAIGAAKKIVDYFKEAEPASMCIAKTVVTALGAALPWVAWVIGSGWRL